jgi:hypothetical protein
MDLMRPVLVRRGAKLKKRLTIVKRRQELEIQPESSYIDVHYG